MCLSVLHKQKRKCHNMLLPVTSRFCRLPPLFVLSQCLLLVLTPTFNLSKLVFATLGSGLWGLPSRILFLSYLILSCDFEFLLYPTSAHLCVSRLNYLSEFQSHKCNCPLVSSFACPIGFSNLTCLKPILILLSPPQQLLIFTSQSTIQLKKTKSWKLSLNPFSLTHSLYPIHHQSLIISAPKIDGNSIFLHFIAHPPQSKCHHFSPGFL